MLTWIALVIGLVEGLTEFLPVSSIGHLIIVGQILNFTGDHAKPFEIIIQIAAIFAAIVLYWKNLRGLFGGCKETNANRGLNLGHVLAAILPAVLVGLFVHDLIIKYFYSPITVIIGLILGGILMIIAEQTCKPVTASGLDEITYKQAFIIGLFQCLALWPGFSRSGAAISGGLASGLNHRTAADFSFIQAIPIMIAASGLDLFKSMHTFSKADFSYFTTGFVTAFIAAAAALLLFIKLISKVKLLPFAYYHFILAAVLTYLFYF